MQELCFTRSHKSRCLRRAPPPAPSSAPNHQYALVSCPPYNRLTALKLVKSIWPSEEVLKGRLAPPITASVSAVVISVKLTLRRCLMLPLGSRYKQPQASIAPSEHRSAIPARRPQPRHGMELGWTPCTGYLQHTTDAHFSHTPSSKRDTGIPSTQEAHLAVAIIHTCPGVDPHALRGWGVALLSHGE